MNFLDFLFNICSINPFLIFEGMIIELPDRDRVTTDWAWVIRLIIKRDATL